MKFINKWYFIIWFIVLIFFFFFTSSITTLCWDGIDIDEELLMQNCGVTSEQYWQKIEEDNSFCPSASEAVRSVGGCGPDWILVGAFLIFVSVIYNTLYTVVYFIARKKK